MIPHSCPAGPAPRPIRVGAGTNWHRAKHTSLAGSLGRPLSGGAIPAQRRARHGWARVLGLSNSDASKRLPAPALPPDLSKMGMAPAKPNPRAVSPRQERIPGCLRRWRLLVEEAGEPATLMPSNHKGKPDRRRRNIPIGSERQWEGTGVDAASGPRDEEQGSEEGATRRRRHELREPQRSQSGQASAPEVADVGPARPNEDRRSVIDHSYHVSSQQTHEYPDHLSISTMLTYVHTLCV